MVYGLLETTPLLFNRIRLDGRIQTKTFGTRHVQAFLMFGGLVFGYFLRVNISAAIVPMTKPSTNQNIPHYDWDNGTRSLILSSFFWGYVIAQLPSGILAKRYGAKIVLSSATVVCSILTLLVPLAAKIGGWELLCCLRVVTGLAQGVVYPCVHTLLAKWAPSTERGILTTTVYSGAQLGTVIILATSGVMFDSQMGWPGIFYISGGIALAWSVAFYIFGADSPDDSNHISKEEREYIKALTGSRTDTQEMSIPWKAIFMSVPFYALIAAHCGFTWGFYTLLTEMPTYLANVLLLDVRSNALLSALPYFAMWILCLIVSPISDMLINRGYLGVTASRKIFNSIGQWVPMACLIALGYMTSEDKVMAITLLTIGVGFNSASFVGYLVNHMDLSPNFAGTMMGITNGFSNLMSIFAPLVVGAVVDDESNPEEWRIVFYITAGVYLGCNLLFVIFGSGKVQPWNEPHIEWNSQDTLTTNGSSNATLDSIAQPQKSFEPKDL